MRRARRGKDDDSHLDSDGSRGGPRRSRVRSDLGKLSSCLFDMPVPSLKLALEEPRLRRSNLDVHQLTREVRLAGEVHQLVGPRATVPPTLGGAFHQDVDTSAEIARVDFGRNPLLQ